ncbi:MAG TPA: 3-deoxy-D-manno-octulosonic acid transferase [Thermoguttaceae bacterium]|nr:3-deoxy-D-manno-octulosonic acid transferase [Thermoguttaceae bacterium]
MPYLLNVIYILLIIAAMPWLVWSAVRKGKYREGFAAKFLGRVPSRDSEKPCLWLHAVSVGEVNLLAPLIKELRRQRPDLQCVISTTTMTGMVLARKKYAEQTVFYCPLDFSWAVRAAMRRIRPDMLVLAELELWPNLIRAAKQHGARVAVINGRLSEHSFRGYRRIRPLVGRLLGQIDLVAVQDATYGERFRELGTPPDVLHVTGSMKYDGAQTDRQNPKTEELRQLARLTDEHLVLLAGSTQDPEESIVLDVFRRLSADWPQLRLVLVPRHPDRFAAVGRLLDQSDIHWQRRTELSPSTNNNFRVLLVDVVGELGAWWGTAQLAFVGGSFGDRGGQNMIEPAGYGAAVSFGPNTRNFRDIVTTMLAHDAAAVVEDGQALEQFLRRCLETPDYAQALGDRAQKLVLEQLGATERTCRLLGELVRQPTPSNGACPRDAA